MNCPNCGTYYDENEKICKKCHTPLSNAVYNQVSSGNDINQPAPKRKSFVPIVVAILICCLIAGGIGGYFYYISRVKQGCREATRQIFTYAKNMDFSDVAEGRCPLARAAVTHPDLPNLSLLTAPMSLSPDVTATRIRALLRTARDRYDYIMIDSPAGLGPGFQLAVCGADRALVVATNDASSLRDAQRTVEELYRIRQVHLVMNRIQPRLLRQLRTTIDDAMDAAGLPLIGVIPEDRRVILAANLGRPLILEGRQGAANACLNIAKRLEGYRVPVMRIR